MKKNYEKWIFQKRYINNERKRPKKYIEGGIYWAYLGENIGFERLNNLLTVVSEKTLADIKRVLIDMIIN